MYINTIVWNYRMSVCTDIKRYVSWNKLTDKSPCWLSFEKDINIVVEKLEDPNILFIRKIKDMQLLDIIDKRIRI